MIELKNLTDLSLRVIEKSHEYVGVSVSPALLKELIILGEFFRVCASNECFITCREYQ
ncbi:MAG: hypothetical protein QN229_05385 [Desulfurococcaceae archaeon TW002]